MWSNAIYSPSSWGWKHCGPAGIPRRRVDLDVERAAVPAAPRRERRRSPSTHQCPGGASVWRWRRNPDFPEADETHIEEVQAYFEPPEGCGSRTVTYHNPDGFVDYWRKIAIALMFRLFSNTSDVS